MKTLKELLDIAAATVLLGLFVALLALVPPVFYLFFFLALGLVVLGAGE